MTFSHIPVLCTETIEALNIKPNGRYLDATFGRGGHSRAILEKLGPKGCLIAMDRDPEALSFAPPDLLSDPRFHLHYGHFSELQSIVRHHQCFGALDGVLLDVGVSSPQLDDPKRGFSFTHNGPLDMRMDPTQGISAAEWLQEASEAQISHVLKTLGEEPFHKRIASHLVEARAKMSIQDTATLAKLITEAIPTRFHVKGKNPATQSFQAIRIHVNNELTELETALSRAVAALHKGGRLCVISFHSLEDRLVKRFFQAEANGNIPKDIPLRESEVPRILKVLGRVRASSDEIAQNPRSRSATLRIAEKVV